jgi:hypothetical protein
MLDPQRGRESRSATASPQRLPQLRKGFRVNSTLNILRCFVLRIGLNEISKWLPFNYDDQEAYSCKELFDQPNLIWIR